MSETWRYLFANKINEYVIADSWDLSVDPNLGKEGKGCIYTQQTFGSFRCSRCLRSWNSSKVSVLFLLNLNTRLKCGTVKMRIFKQACERCKRPDENPTISFENIARVVSNLVNKIFKKFYGSNGSYKELNPKISGPLDGPHNLERCEACRYGLCEQQMPSGDHGSPSSSSTPSALSVIAMGIGALALMYLTSK